MSFILFILFIVFFIIFFGASIIGAILKALFGFGGKRSSNYTSHTGNSSQHEEEMSKPTRKHKKVFDKNDGEYVDFEEIEK